MPRKNPYMDQDHLSNREKVGDDRIYNEEENEWLRACLSYRSVNNKNSLNACDYLKIAHALGYRRADG